ncbi:MAG: hypothetical protein GF317_21180 [Candidatus Lokiarchaeota archaeon]|nr:hypothetical protein [Candidatus Lokiarchaeota archaeon]MBD3201971.1 hypothetical protein [Candidatus Lokiarchaeota archaeon]
MSSKSFKDLKREVHDKGICQECGGCVSFCSSAEFNVIGFEKSYSPPVYINEENCLECGICYYLCPQTHILDEDLNKIYNCVESDTQHIGHYKDIYSCQTNDIEFLDCGTDGGIVNTLLSHLIEIKFIDGAIVSQTDAPFSREAKFIEKKEELIESSGLQLDVSSQLEEIQKFSTYTHSIQQLNHYKFKKLGIVGTPCQIYTIRCMQNLGVTPSENIGICLGLFCYENFLFDKSEASKFQKDFNVRLENVEKVNIKQDLVLACHNEDFGKKRLHIPFNHLDKYMRKACKACSDFSNIYADISFGGLGSLDKFTTIITRTELGDRVFKDFLNSQKINCRHLEKSEKNRIRDLITQYSQKKIKRKNQFMKKVN